MMLLAGLLAAGLLADDPELRAWQKLTGQIESDIYRADPSAGYYLKGGYDWRREAEACETLACAREAYSRGLSEMLGLYDEGTPVPIRGAKAYKAPMGTRGYGGLLTLDLGEGWTFFWLQAGYLIGPRDDPAVRQESYAGLIRIQDGRAAWRNDDGEGVDLQLVRGAWRVTHISRCQAACAHIGGVYRPTLRPFNEHP